MRRKEHQSGFGTTVILLVVLVVSALAVTGLVVYQHHKQNSTATNQTQTTTQAQSTTSAQPAQTATQSLDIKEWGVHMTLNNVTASMYYYTNPNLPDVAYLSLKMISAIAPNCAADKYSLGSISRITPAQHQAALSDPTKGDPGTVQIGNYWYSFSSPQGGCISSGQDAAVQHALPGYNIGEISKAFDTLTAD